MNWKWRQWRAETWVRDRERAERWQRGRRRFSRFVAFLGLLLIGGPSAFIGIICSGGGAQPPREMIAPFPMPARDESLTFLTVPERLVVAQTDEYARHLAQGRPSAFPYFTAARDYWGAVNTACGVTTQEYAFNAGQQIIQYTYNIFIVNVRGDVWAVPKFAGDSCDSANLCRVYIKSTDRRHIYYYAHLNVRTAADSEVRAVSMMIGSSRVSARWRRIRQTSSPLTTGRFRSRMTRSGGRPAIERSASSPRPTISTEASPDRSSVCLIRPAMSCSSSTTSTRGGATGCRLAATVLTSVTRLLPSR
jgi:hypothetical protein